MKTESSRIKEVQSKHNENRFTATTPEEMFGHYAAEDINQVWTEDYADEETGTVVPVERHQLVFEKGTFFDNRNIDTVRFHFESGAISSALVSDQCRIGREVEHYGLQAYKVKVSVNGKNHVIVCQARSLTMAHEIVQDWCELHLDKTFIIMAVSELSTGIILDTVLKKREEASAEQSAEAAEYNGDDIEEADTGADDKPKSASKVSGYYEVLLEIKFKSSKKDFQRSDIKGFLVQAKDADSARDACFGYIDLMRSYDEAVEEIRIIGAAPFNRYKVIEREFTATYIAAEKSNQQNS